MKKTLFWAALAAALLFAASCASTPPQKPQPEPQVQAQPEKPAVPAPEAELAKAKELKSKADRYSLADYAPDEYAAAVKDLAAGESAYGKDNAASKQSLDKAISGFTAVISKGGALLVEKIQAQSAASKKAADDIKAPVAVKNEYAAALGVYNRALAEKAAGDLETAGNDFAQARDMFDAVYQKARDKREQALKAIQQTDQALTESEQKASEAQQSLDSEGIPVQGGGQ
jgi:hypothetical protein